MSMRDLIPWGRQENRAPSLYRSDETRDPFWSLRREMDRLFDDTFRTLGLTSPSFGRSMGWPSVEVSETEHEVRVTAEVPGLTEKDIELTVDDGVLTLRGERRGETDDRDRGYSERFYGRFERRIALPARVEDDEATARYENGVLTVTMPKSPEAARGRRIPINGHTTH